MPDFESEHFRGGWEYKYQRKGIWIWAVCKKSGKAALSDVPNGLVKLICPTCELMETIEREKLERGPG